MPDDKASAPVTESPSDPSRAGSDEAPTLAPGVHIGGTLAPSTPSVAPVIQATPASPAAAQTAPALSRPSAAEIGKATQASPSAAEIAKAMASLWVRAGEVSPRRREAHRLAAEVRRLADLLVRTDAGIDALASAADQLGAIVDRLAEEGVRDRRAALGRVRSHVAVARARRKMNDDQSTGQSTVVGSAGASSIDPALDSTVSSNPEEGVRFAESSTAGAAIGAALADPGRADELMTEHGHFDDSPVVGLANPLAPPVHVEIQGETVIGWATFGEQYEGPPGKVHGGYVAAAFDDVLGMAQSMGGRPGMTGRLTIRYRAPHPLHTRIRYEGRLVSVDGRKTLVAGASYDGDQLLAEAEGLFISVDFSTLLPPAPA